jgi:ribosome-binding factor A
MRHGSPRRYPRMARVNEVVLETVADELERLSDPRLGFVTVTGVEVSPDLRHATVYYSALDSVGRRPTSREVDVVAQTAEREQRQEQTRAALKSAAPHLRAELGRQVRLKYVPELVFREDPAIAQGERVEAIIRDLHRDDAVAPELPADGGSDA